MKTCIMKEVRWIPLRSQHNRVCTTQNAILRNNYGFIQLRGECGHGILMLVNSFNPSRREFKVPEYRQGVKDPNTTQWRRGSIRHTAMLVKVFQWLDSTSAKELERGLPTGSRLWYQLVTPSIQSYTNHTRKCVRSRSRTHGKISQHNSRHKLK